MHMSFWWDCQIDNFIFPGLNIKTTVGLVFTCLAIASLAFLFEFLRYLQALQRQKELYLRSQQLRAICPSESSILLTRDAAEPANPIHISQGLLLGTDITLWIVVQNLSYLLMLSAMLYNGWLFMAAVIGGGLGYFVFGQMFMKINLENCRIMRQTFCMQKCGSEANATSPSNGESTPALDSASPSTSQATLSCHNKSVAVNVHQEADDV